jgi:parallel beta-helix repeat protein
MVFVISRYRIYSYILVILFMFYPSFSVHAATYYVNATDGNDNNDGLSENTALKSLEAINKLKLYPGEKVLLKRDEIWREQLVIPSSGMEGSIITFGAYGDGSRPIITSYDILRNWQIHHGAGNIWQTTCNKEPHIVYFDNVKGIKVDSINSVNSNAKWFWKSNTLYVYATSNPAYVFLNPGIEVSQRDLAILNSNKDYVKIENLTLRGNNESSHYAASLYLGLQADNNEVYNCIIERSWQSGIVIEGGNNNSIHNCIIRENNNDGIWIAFSADGTKFSNNVLYENARGFIGDRNAIGIWNSKNIEISGNHITFTGNGKCLEFGSDDGSTTGLRVYNNFFDNSQGKKQTLLFYRGDYSLFYNIFIGNRYNENIMIVGDDYKITLKLFNNVVYGGNENIEIYDEGYLNPQSSLNIKNNIIINSNLFHLVIKSAWAESISSNNIDYNSYYPHEGFLFKWKNYKYNFTSWTENSVQDANSISKNPRFLSLNPITPNDFHLAPSSPCIDAGVDLGLTHDFFSNSVPQGNGADIGVFEQAPEISNVSKPFNLRIQLSN